MQTGPHPRTPNTRRRAARRRIVLTILLFVAASALADPSINTGSDADARAYYATLKPELGFSANPGATNLDALLDFAGYPTTGQRLEQADSGVLMDPNLASSAQGLGIPARGLNGATLREGDILAARFFAPKIVNVNASTPVPGWRKLVRLRARPDSAAARTGVESVIILFNYLAPVGTNPFGGTSFNTQVMLIAPSHANRLYWLDFDQTQTLTTALNASFDAADLPTNSYFVPDGCNDCHGSPANLRAPMINYLDTDHWFDRLDDDFAPLKKAGTPILFDANTNDHTQPQFAKAFDTIRRFNEEALAQNSAVQPDGFETEAARTWLGLHAQSDDHVLPEGRGFPMKTGEPTWQPTDAAGVRILNRYCFRCHGSVRFSIFNRASVVDRAGIMRQRLRPSKPQTKIPGFKMPPDRVMNPADLQALDNFLRKLGAKP